MGSERQRRGPQPARSNSNLAFFPRWKRSQGKGSKRAVSGGKLKGMMQVLGSKSSRKHSHKNSLQAVSMLWGFGGAKMQVIVIDSFCGRDSLQVMEHGGLQTCWRLTIPCRASLQDGLLVLKLSSRYLLVVAIQIRPLAWIHLSLPMEGADFKLSKCFCVLHRIHHQQFPLHSKLMYEQPQSPRLHLAFSAGPKP